MVNRGKRIKKVEACLSPIFESVGGLIQDERVLFEVIMLEEIKINFYLKRNLTGG